MNLPSLLSIATVAQRLDLSKATVRKMLHAGDFGEAGQGWRMVRGQIRIFDFAYDAYVRAPLPPPVISRESRMAIAATQAELEARARRKSKRRQERNTVA